MANFNTEKFMASISAELQEKVKACRTAEELQALADANKINLRDFAEGLDEDAELLLDDLDGVSGGKGFAPIAIAALMTFTTISAALTGCSSVENTAAKSSAYVRNAALDNADMNRNDTEDDLDVNTIRTEFNKSEAYSVEFTESDLVFAQDSK